MALNLVDHITLCEVGPRDGLQNERRILTVQEKQELIEAAADAGFPVIEVGSFMSPKAVPQMADTDEVFTTLLRREGVEYRALIANLKGVERAAACGCKKVKLNVSASKAHNLANLNRTPNPSPASAPAWTRPEAPALRSPVRSPWRSVRRGTVRSRSPTSRRS